MTQPKRSISHEEATIASFRNDPEFALVYLNEVLEDGDPAECMIAFRRVVEAMGGISKLAMETAIHEKNLQRTFSEKGNPTLKSLLSIVRSLGLKLEIAAQDPDQLKNIVQDASKYPILDMIKRGWLPKVKSAKKQASELLSNLLAKLDMKADDLCVAAYRQSSAHTECDQYARAAWLLGVKFTCQKQIEDLAPYKDILHDNDFLKKIIKFSGEPQGIKKVCSFLNSNGIAIAIVPHLKKTYLDGAVFFWKGHPVVALTLRYDRIDSFWFTLLHELSHIVLGHVKPADETPIFDDIYTNNPTMLPEMEHEADSLAQEIALPKEIWKKYETDLLRAKIVTMTLVAEELGIHKAIVAGRIRHDKKDYRVLSQHVGSGMVRRLFPEAFQIAQATN